MNSIAKDKLFWFLLVFATVYILFNIGSGSLTTFDESTHAIAAREMLQNNTWTTIYVNGQPWFDKPPLYIWSTALFYKFLGINEFSSRFTSAIFGVFTIILIYLFGLHIANKRVGLLAALVLLGAPHYLHFAKMAMLDVTLTFFVVLTVYLFVKGEKDNRYLFYSGLAIALAYLTKGFAGFLGFFIICLYVLITNRIKFLFNRNFIMGVALCAIIISLWHIGQYLIFGKEAVSDYFGTHIFGRALKAMDMHTGGINFYQKAVFNKSKPWSVLMFASAAYMLWLSFKHKYKSAILICCWILVTYGLYTFVSTKIHWYIMPIYPALALSSGIFLERFLKGKLFISSLVIILLILLFQISYSWAFKIDFSPDVKMASSYVKGLDKNGFDVYRYGGYDNKDVFYFGDFAKFIPIDEKMPAGSYCVLSVDDLKKVRSEGKIDLKEIKRFNNIVVIYIKE